MYLCQKSTHFYNLWVFKLPEQFLVKTLIFFLFLSTETKAKLVEKSAKWNTVIIWHYN